jgi:cytochrome P450
LAPVVRLIMGSGMMDRLPNQAAADTQKFYNMAGHKMAERQFLDEEAKAHGTDVRRDLFHYIFRSRDPETGLGLNQQKLQADAGLLIAAGSDGVAVTVAAAMFYLLRDPERMQKLVDEIRSSFDNLDDVRTPKLNQLSYLAAVLDEAMRLAPSVPSPFPRVVLPGGLVVDGERIPAGITVGVAAYCIHHNETYYPDSFSFRPERWITNKNDPESAKSVAQVKAAFLNFGAGPYNCIGKSVAILASKLVLAKMLYQYDVRVPNGVVTGGGGPGLGQGREREEEYQLQDILVSYRSGPMVQLQERKH